jgi:hypothetical protein
VRPTRPENVKRCYYCGARPKMACGELTIFHLPGCKPAETKDKATGKYRVEILYPGICHGGYVPFFTL